VAVSGEVDFGGAFGIEQRGDALYLGEAGFFNAPVLEPGMDDAPAESGVKFTEEFHP
jgi:hypothetical protein